MRENLPRTPNIILLYSAVLPPWYDSNRQSGVWLLRARGK
jgi:hypothetical protein